MSINLRVIFRVVIVLIVQALIDNYLNLGTYIYIAIFPFLILSLQYKVKTLTAMILSFLLGICVDILGNGVIGLNASALVAMALFRQYFVGLVVNEQGLDKYDYPNVRDIGFFKYALYALLSLLVFMIVYLYLESMSFTPIMPYVLKLLLSSFINLAILLLISSLFRNRRD